MPSPSPISALTVQPARSTVGAALRPLPGFGVNRDFFFLVVSQYPVSVDSYPIKHRGHAGLSLGLMSPLFDGEPDSPGIPGKGSSFSKVPPDNALKDRRSVCRSSKLQKRSQLKCHERRSPYL